MSRVTEIFIRASGPIKKGPTLFYYGANKSKPAVKFILEYIYKDKTALVEKRYVFVAFDRIAEFIATRFTRGSVITVLAARPAREKKVGPSRTHYGDTWVVEKIAPPTQQEQEEAGVTEFNLAGVEE